MKSTEIIKLLKGGVGSGRHKEIISQAEQESQRLSSIADGKTVHKRNNVRAKLEGFANLLKECSEESKIGEYVSKINNSLREAAVFKSKKGEALKDWIRNG